MEAPKPTLPENKYPSPYTTEEVAENDHSGKKESYVFSVAEGSITSKGLERQPAVASDRVIGFAEADIPTEQTLEKRHEVVGEHAASIGSVLAQRAALQSSGYSPRLTVPSVTQLPSGVSGNAPKYRQLRVQSHGLYGQAIRAGFICALILLILFILLSIII